MHSQGTDSETEDEHGMDEGDEAQLFQQRREAQSGEGDINPEQVATPVSSDERHKITNQVSSSRAIPAACPV